MPVDYLTGSFLGVSVGLGWARSFMHHEEEGDVASGESDARLQCCRLQRRLVGSLDELPGGSLVTMLGLRQWLLKCVKEKAYCQAKEEVAHVLKSIQKILRYLK